MKRITGGRIPALVTVVATLALLVRLAVPAPTIVVSAPDAVLAALGATMCHQDDGDTRGLPAVPVVCDHCDLCVVATPLLPAPVSIPMPVRLVAQVLPNGLTSAASPRGPPRWASNPRAPPALI